MSIPDGAKYFFNLGLPIIPFKFIPESGKKPSKKPLVLKWAQWQTQPQTLQELESLPWSMADGWFVVCGVKASNGYYFVAFDRDADDFNFTEVPPTVFEQTPNNGYHAYYWSKVNHRGRKFHECQLEFLGEGNLCGMYPILHTGSNEYECIAKVDDAWQIFTRLVENAGCFQDEGEMISVPLLLEGSPEHGDETHFPRDEAGIRLATYYRVKGNNQEETFRLLKEWNLKNRPPLSEAKLREKVQGAFKNPNPYSWRWFESGTSEEVEQPAAPDVTPKALKALEEYVNDLKQRILGAQVAAEPYECLDALYEMLVKFYQTSLRLDPLTPYLLASYTLLTHQTPNLDFIFQIYITGLKGSGKSTVGERLENLCYQGFKTGSATFPFLVRANEVLNGMTQVLDEFDLIAGDDRVTKYLRGSSDRRNPYGVVEPVSIGGQTYNMPAIKMSFGARVLITSQQIKDEMVRDRAVEVVMMQYAGLLPEPSVEEITKLKAHLAYYREQVKLKVTIEDKQKHYDVKHSSGRLNELSTLLYKVTPENHHDRIAAITSREWETRTALERESYTAKVVEALTAAVLADDTREAPTGETFIAVQEIKYHYDQLYADTQTGKGKTRPASIGRTMQNLGLKTTQFRIKDEEQRRRGWRLDKAALVRIRQSLYLDEISGFVSVVSNVTAPSAPPLGLDTFIEEKAVHTLVAETTETEEEAVHTLCHVPNVPKETT